MARTRLPGPASGPLRLYCAPPSIPCLVLLQQSRREILELLAVLGVDNPQWLAAMQAALQQQVPAPSQPRSG